MKGLTKGRIVYYVQSDPTPYDDGIRVAVITRVFNDEGLVNLSVFADGTYDPPTVSPVSRLTSVSYSEGKQPRTWHWPERVT